MLLQGGSAGSSALLVQGNGFVTLASVVASNGGAPTLILAQETEIGDFAAGARPPTPVVDVRGSAGVAYLIPRRELRGRRHLVRPRFGLGIPARHRPGHRRGQRLAAARTRLVQQPLR